MPLQIEKSIIESERDTRIGQPLSKLLLLSENGHCHYGSNDISDVGGVCLGLGVPDRDLYHAPTSSGFLAYFTIKGCSCMLRGSVQSDTHHACRCVYV